MEKENKNFIKKIGMYFVGNMASKILTALLIPIYAFYITSADLGAYDYSQAIMQIIVPVAYMAIWEGILKFVISEEDIKQQNKYIGTALFISIVSTVIVILFVCLLCHFGRIQYPVLVCIMMLTYTYGMIFQYCSRALGQNMTYVLSGFFAVVVNFIGIIFFVIILKQGLLGLYISYILGQLANGIFSFCKLKMWTLLVYIKPNWKVAKVLLMFSVPMAVNLASSWIINGAGKIIINTKLGNEANGIYSYANKFGNLVTMVTNVVSMALMEEFYIRMKNNEIKKYFSAKCNQIWELILSVFLFVLPVIGIYFRFIQNTEYFVALYYVPVCIMTACFAAFATNVGGVFQIKNITHFIFLSTLLGGMVTFFLSVVLIDQYGIIGVLLAQLSGTFALLAIRYYVAHRLLDYTIAYTKTALLMFLIILESYAVIKFQNIFCNIIVFLLNTIFVCYMYRNVIRGVIKKKFK